MSKKPFGDAVTVSARIWVVVGTVAQQTVVVIVTTLELQQSR